MKSKGQIAKLVPSGPVLSGVERVEGIAYAKTGFTIIELLTVLSIIVILLGILLPSLNAVKWYAKFTTQKNQLKNFDTGLRMFEIDFKEYPDSSALGGDSKQYCGAMKLAEALAGQDGLGFNSNSIFRADGKDDTGTDLYPRPAPAVTDPAYQENLRSRKEYVEPKDVKLCTLEDLYGSSVGSFNNADKIALLTDVYRTAKNLTTGKKIGMPVLYYKADPTKLLNDTNSTNFSQNIYNYLDNQEFLKLGLPWDTATTCPLYNSGGTEGLLFYQKILDKSALPIQRPHNKDSYILISAGKDGIYGTRDDVYNFAD